MIWPQWSARVSLRPYLLVRGIQRNKPMPANHQKSEIRSAALEYARHGLRLIRLNGKVPLDRDWPSVATNDPEQLLAWFANPRWNIGLPTGSINGIVVLDFDNKAAGRSFFRRHQDAAKLIVETRRGVHFWFRIRASLIVRNSVNHHEVCDVRGEGGQVVIPPSIVNGFNYRFVPGFEFCGVEQLALFDPSWAPKQQMTPNSGNNAQAIAKEDLLQLRKRAYAYISQICALSGQRGHDTTFRVCCILRDFGVPPHEAWHLLQKWNETNAKPHWSVKELEHKWHDAFHLASDKK